MADTSRRDAVFDKLQNKVNNLHIVKARLRGGCPQCGGEDRFFTGPDEDGKTDTDHAYTFWVCHGCGHKTTTSALLGQSFVSEVRPAVKAWEDSADNGATVATIRELYTSLATFAHDALWEEKAALNYLGGRKVHHKIITDAKIGYIDGRLYKVWWRGMTPEQQHAAATVAGLPEGSTPRLTGFDAMFTAGYAGKIVFPYWNAQGETVDIRTRSISDNDTIGGKKIRYTSPRLSPDARGVNVPYGIWRIGNANRVVLTEGEFKVLVPWSLGVTVPVIGLRGIGDNVLPYLDELRGRLVILAFDNDDKHDANGMTPGELATVRIGRILRAYDIDVVVNCPGYFGNEKGLDDYVAKSVFGGAAANDLFDDKKGPMYTRTLPEFEGMLTQRGADLSKMPMPRSNVGTVRQWAPSAAVDDTPHKPVGMVSLDEARSQIQKSAAVHIRDYNPGNPQLMITSSAGTGKTTIVMDEVNTYAASEGKTVAVFLPNHDTIDEKIADGTLRGYRHIYGRHGDADTPFEHIDGNCEQADLANAMTKKGYMPSRLLCPKCEFLTWCEESGYKAQFKGKANRAYVHQHAFTSYPESEDIAVIDELTHTKFIEDMTIWADDILAATRNNSTQHGQIALLDAIIKMFGAPDLGDTEIDGAEFYEVLQRFYPKLRDVDVWGSSNLVQFYFDAMASAYQGTGQDLPQQFGQRLFAVMSDDVRRLSNNMAATGRLRFVTHGKPRLILTTGREGMPKWYNETPTIILNATADEDVMQLLVGSVKVVAPVVPIADGNTVVQDVSLNNAKSTHVGKSEQAEKRRQQWFEQIQSHITDEGDTLIVTTLALEPAVKKEFPRAKVAHYGALEGRNDLQRTTTILASSPAVNLPAVQREAAALWPGIDTTLTRRRVAFEYTNASDEVLSVEQIDAVDPRVRSILWQHRDATVIQAVHRARLVNRTGCKVVVLFSRPIPGLVPTSVIVDRPSVSKHTTRQVATMQKLLDAAGLLSAERGGFNLATLTEHSGVAKSTAHKYWQEVTKALGMKWFDVKCRHPMPGGRGSTVVDLRVALTPETLANVRLQGVRDRYNNEYICIANALQPWLPDGWEIDPAWLQSMMPPPAAVETPAETVIEAGSSAIWRNGAYDEPVTITGVMGKQGGVTYYSIEGSSTGVPSTQLVDIVAPAPKPAAVPINDMLAIYKALRPVVNDGAILTLLQAQDVIGKVRAAGLDKRVNVTAVGASNTAAYGQAAWTISGAAALVGLIESEFVEVTL